MDTFLEQGSLARNSGDPPIFTAIPVDLEEGRSQRRLSRLVTASGSVLAAFQGGEVARSFPLDDEKFAPIDFGRDRPGEVSKLLLDPTGFHALMTNSSGDSWPPAPRSMALTRYHLIFVFEDRRLEAVTGKRPSQQKRVLAAHADCLFRKGKEIEAARKFAEATVPTLGIVAALY
eukprot:Skav209907  [mRNA]  locus=scaffold1253:14183:21086:- [translate_table: standard]